MKKLLLFVFAITAMVSCSSDSGENQIDSQLKIDNVGFSPDQDADGVHYRNTYKVVQDDTTVQIFTLEKGQPVNGNWQIFQVQISYPTAQGANGTYNFDVMNSGQALGFFQIPSNSGFTIDHGSVTVKDLGQDNYKLTFNNVTATHYLGTLPNKSVTGYFKGHFTVSIPSDEIPID